MMAPSWSVLTGDCREVLKTLEAESAHCVVTSPPYLGLRDYGTAEWIGGDAECDHAPRAAPRSSRPSGGLTAGKSTVDAGAVLGRVCHCGAVRHDPQIGIEETPQEYVDALVDVFREVRRVLRKDGTVWLNLGSSFANGRIESEECVLRDDLTDDERAYVFQELSRHFAAESEALSKMQPADASTKHDVPEMLQGCEHAPRQVDREGVR